MNNFFNSFVLFVVAAVLALATLVQGMVALFEFLRRGHTRRVLVLCMVACLLIAGLAGYGALNAPAQTSPNSPAQPSSSMIATDSQTPSPTSTTNTVTPSPTPGKAYAEQEGSLGAPTFASPYSGKEGPKIPAGVWVQVSCKVYAPTIPSASPDGYWYRIASSPWNNVYYAIANTFLNGDVLGHPPYTHNTDPRVPNC
ncbi:MAG: hypothetical protein ACJ788_16655 [Ktedonobacteraceae bacterium]